MVSREMVMTDTEKTAKTRRPMSPRRKLYLTSIVLAGLIGAVMGAWMAIADPTDGAAGIALVSNSPLTASFAIGASVLWVVGMAVCMFLYHRAVDDHEERAWLWACVSGWYVFMFAAPVWWMLHRASLASPPDAMLLFIGTLIVNGAVWLWLKYR